MGLFGGGGTSGPPGADGADGADGEDGGAVANIHLVIAQDVLNVEGPVIVDWSGHTPVSTSGSGIAVDIVTPDTTHIVFAEAGLYAVHVGGVITTLESLAPVGSLIVGCATIGAVTVTGLGGQIPLAGFLTGDAAQTGSSVHVRTTAADQALAVVVQVASGAPEDITVVLHIHRIG